MLFLRDLPRKEALRVLADHFPGLDLDAVEATLALLTAAQDLLEAHEAQIQSYGFSRGRFSVLMLLNRSPKGEASPSELAKGAKVTRATITGLLDGLEKEGLVERIPHEEDRRRLRVRLTPKGRKSLGRMLPKHVSRVTSLVAPLDKKEMKTLTRLLDKVVEGLHGRAKK